MNRRSVLALAGAAGCSLMGSAAAQTPSSSPTSGNQSALLGGDAIDLIPMGAPGVFEVVLWAFLPSDYTKKVRLAVVARNNTDAPVFAAQVTATATAADGSLFAVANSYTLMPGMTPPGGVAFRAMDFGGAKVTPDMKLDFTANLADKGEEMYALNPGLTIVSAKRIDSRIVGVARNDAAHPVRASFIYGLAFEAGKIVTDVLDVFGFTSALPVGATQPFQAEVRLPFDKFLIAVN